MFSNSINLAFRMAEYAHRECSRTPDGAFRKYADAGTPYIVHPVAVMALAMQRPWFEPDWHGPACLLHDVIEDTTYDPENIRGAFRPLVYATVVGLTKYSKRHTVRGNRAERNAADLADMVRQPNDVRAIKLCDRLDNLSDLSQWPEDFLALYKRESLALVDAIGAADEVVAGEIRRICIG